jgi:predicted metal-binding protein
MTHKLFVCTTCASTWKDGKRVGVSGGELLLQELQKLNQTWSLQTKFLIQPVECMSACNRPCVVALASEGKYTYLFGDLPVDFASLPTTAAAILTCASKYNAQSDGNLPWSERPVPLKKGIVARIPPMQELALLK